MGKYETYREHILESTRECALPPCFLAALLKIESNFEPMAVSSAGAVGIAQFMPDTAREMGLVVNNEIDERMDAPASINACARYLKYLYNHTWIANVAEGTTAVLTQLEKYRWVLVLAAYNSGMGRVRQFRGIPPINETLTYIVKHSHAMEQISDFERDRQIS